jgi:hypothetical protein
MSAAGALAPEGGVEKSPILAAKNRHTMPSNFQRNSLKTNDGDPHKVTHFSRLGISPEKDRR